MGFYFCPTERCTIDQAMINTQSTGLKVFKNNLNAYGVSFANFHVVLKVCSGWIRGAHGLGIKNFDSRIYSIITQLTNCEWIGEDDNEAMQIYLFWYDYEIRKEARMCVEDEIEINSGKSRRTVDEKIQDEVEYFLDLRKKYNLKDSLPLAKPIRNNYRFEGLKNEKVCVVC